MWVALDRKEYFPLTYSTEAQLLHRMRRFEEELTLLEKPEAICLEVGDKNTLLRDYVLRALALPALQRPRRHSHFSKSKKRSLVNYEEALQVGYPAYELILEECGRTEEARQFSKHLTRSASSWKTKPGLLSPIRRGDCWRVSGARARPQRRGSSVLSNFSRNGIGQIRPNDRDTIQAMPNDL